MRPTAETNRKNVAIVMATYNPDAGFLRLQLDSIRAQTHTEWVCFIEDDASDEAFRAEVEALAATDPRFRFFRNRERLGPFRNFERGLGRVGASFDYICFSDQDDEWEPHKLARLISAFGSDVGVQLVHSDLSVIDREGMLLHPSCWAREERYCDETGACALLMRNNVTGCALMFRAELLAALLPFPVQRPPSRFHHDLWAALVARAFGRIIPLAEPLVRYRQHGNNVVGAEVERTTPVIVDYMKAATAPLGVLRRSKVQYGISKALSDQFMERVRQVRPESYEGLARRSVFESGLRGWIAGVRQLCVSLGENWAQVHSVLVHLIGKAQQ